jgi:Ca-activated chloride channel family protein
LPWYFGVKAFHGEEYSSDPAEVEPQHLAPNDAMAFHQIIAACNPDEVDANDTIEAHVEYLHPLTLEPMSETLAVPLGELVVQDASELYKADVVVSFAKALIVIGAQMQQGEHEAAYETAQGMEEWLNKAASTLDDPEVQELALLMHDYVTVLMP